MTYDHRNTGTREDLLRALRGKIWRVAEFIAFRRERIFMHAPSEMQCWDRSSEKPLLTDTDRSRSLSEEDV